jgi:hypothetical protein
VPAAVHKAGWKGQKEQKIDQTEGRVHGVFMNPAPCTIPSRPIPDQKHPASLWSMGLSLLICLLTTGCNSFHDVTALKEIQDTPGYFPKALYYCGSDDTCHYFEQAGPLKDMTLYSKDQRDLMVDRRQLNLPPGAEFPHSEYTGAQDARRQLMRIEITQHRPGQGVAEYAPVRD